MKQAPADSATDEIDRLRTEIDRLRALVGPSEQSYIDLQMAVLGARDAAIGAEAELGTMRGHFVALQAEVALAHRDQDWLRQQVMVPIKKFRAKSPTVARVIRRLSR